MTPLPSNPIVVVYINEQGEIMAKASNIAPDLKVIAVHSIEQWNKEVAGKPFGRNFQTLKESA